MLNLMLFCVEFEWTTVTFASKGLIISSGLYFVVYFNCVLSDLTMSQSLTNSPRIYFQLHRLMTFFSSSGLYSLQTGLLNGTAASGSSPVISWWASSLRSRQSCLYTKREFFINGRRIGRSHQTGIGSKSPADVSKQTECAGQGEAHGAGQVLVRS